MLESSAALAKLRASVFIFAVFILALAISAPRSAAQAADGPQSGATPSDSPSSSQTSRSVPQIGGHTSLAGNWTLNKNQSDDPREKMRDAMGGGGGGGMNGGGGGRQGMGGGGRRGGGGGGQGGGMLADFSQLTIDQTATSAKVTGSSGRVLAIYSSGNSSQSGSATNSSASNDANNSSDSAGAAGGRFESAPAPAQWQGNQLVATAQGRRGGSTTRTYELSPDGAQLYVTTEMDNPRFQQPVTYRLVYDAANAKSGSSQ